ncbi:DUF6270 domain-containing protein [Paenarthrobacter sp. CAP02]|uniref:DUF6270 domain-containing protein n=1 Tax=Paenarthrobacter sp. CAP02 TaxID=3158144 RepID=UPI0032DB9306
MARIFIYGSCVSRDAYEFLDKANNELLGYTARQSLISAVNKPFLANAAAGSLTSRFQVKNLQGDFDGNVLGTLTEVSKTADFIFWDLTDERLGVLEVEADTYITRSTELVQSGLLNDLGTRTWIKFGTDEHFALWEDAVNRFAQLARSEGFQTKIVLFNLPWSMYDDEGGVLGRYWAMTPDEANNTFARYVAAIRNHMDVFLLELPWAATTSSRTHKWTLAPYHYVDKVYQEVVADFSRLIHAADSASNAKKPEMSSTANSRRFVEAWGDAVDAPPRIEMSTGGPSFGVQFEARNDQAVSKRVLISLRLQGADHVDLSKYRIAKSAHSAIGFFRYINIEPGTRSYFSFFDLPAGVTCTGISVHGWQLESGVVLLRSLSIASSPVSVDQASSSLSLPDTAAEHEDVAPIPAGPNHPYTKALVLTTRFSLFLPQNAAWYASNGSRFSSAEEYAKYLYSPARIGPRLDIFTGISLPAIALMAKSNPVLHRVQYSRDLPSEYLSQLENAAEAFPFVRLELVNEAGIPTEPGLVQDFLSVTSQGNDVVFGDARLDDDDVLSSDFFELCAPYLTPEHIGYALSLARGFTGLYEQERVTTLKRVIEPKIAIGLMTIGYFEASSGITKQTLIGSHPTIDQRMPLILDSSSPSYLWMRHLEQDSVLQLDPERARTIVEHSLSRHEAQTVDEGVTAAFPTVPFG